MWILNKVYGLYQYPFPGYDILLLIMQDVDPDETGSSIYRICLMFYNCMWIYTYLQNSLKYIYSLKDCLETNKQGKLYINNALKCIQKPWKVWYSNKRGKK